MALVTIEDSTLTNLANAIRSKSGTTAKIAPQDMADMIRELSLIYKVKAFATGTYTRASGSVSEITVSHNLGENPDIVWCYGTITPTHANNYLDYYFAVSGPLLCGEGVNTTLYSCFVYRDYYEGTTTITTNTAANSTVFPTVNTANLYSGAGYFRYDETYTWMAIVLDK